MSSKTKVVQQSPFNFLPQAQISYNPDPAPRVRSDRFANLVMLSDEFYQEIIAHPIPKDLETVKLLPSTRLVLDLPLWLTYRCVVAKAPASIPIFGPFGLVSHIRSLQYSREDPFSVKLDKWLNTIRFMRPGCPAKLNSHGRSLLRQCPRSEPELIGASGARMDAVSEILAAGCAAPLTAASRPGRTPMCLQYMFQVLVAPSKGTKMAAPPFDERSLRLFLCSIIWERSSPSRVRFAAPNNGAPLTAPGRSAERFLRREKGSLQKATSNGTTSVPKWPLFSLPPTFQELYRV